MARLMPNVGIVKYNGFTFPAPFDAEVQALPMRDTSKRFIKFVRYSFTIRALIAPDDSGLPGEMVDSELSNIRCRLEKAGGSFLFIGQGLGRDLAINAGSTAYIDPATGLPVFSFHVDPTFGPFPTMLSWKPAGSNRAAYIVWSLEVTLPECCTGGAALPGGKFLEHNYSINWNIAPTGATIRKVSGYYETPGYRDTPLAGLTGSNNRSVVSDAENLWNRIFAKFPTPLGFHRTSNHELAPDKRQVNYTITDTEIESDNPYYPFMVNMDIRHRVSGAMPQLFKCINNLSGSVRIAPGTPRHWGWLAFSKVLQKRYKAGDTIQYVQDGPRKKAVRKQIKKIPMSYSFEENIYGRDFNFSFSWWFVGGLREVFLGSGLFTAADLDTPSWPAWNLSMARLTQSARGLAQMGSKPGEDLLISICDSGGLEPPVVNNSATKSFAFLPEFLITEIEKPPSSSDSYAAAEMTAGLRRKTKTIRHSRSKTSQTNDIRMPGSNPANSLVGTNIGASLQESPGASDDVIQIVGSSETSGVLSGYLVRVGFIPSLPTITSVGGQPANITDIRARSGEVARTFAGIPLYATKYEIDFDLPGTPAGDILTTLNSDAERVNYL